MFSSLLQRHQYKLLFTILRNLQCGEIFLTMPDGQQHQFSGPLKGPKADLKIHSKDAVRRILSDGKMGFCEAFMDGQVSSDALPELIELAARHDTYLEDQLKTNLLRKWGYGCFTICGATARTGRRKISRIIMILVTISTRHGLTQP